MPLLFIFCNSFACARIRSALKMASKNTGLWFDVECPGIYKIAVIYAKWLTFAVTILISLKP
jgi:hypothetical protein